MYNQDPNDHPNECLYLSELQSSMMTAYTVSNDEIREYWEDWYAETYGISSHYFDIYYLGNGEFNFETYFEHIPDGPAFDGAQWLVLDGDWETGTIMQAFMWYIDQQCYFSIGQPGPTDQGDGTCTLQGHRTVRFYEQGEAQEHEVD